jgi:four helix bundle protein
MADTSKLRVLDAAERLAADVIVGCEGLDRRRAPGLVEQFIRATSSVPGNIAEAARLGTDANFKRQLRIALASADEAGCHLRILRRAELIPPHTAADFDARRRMVCRMLQALIRRLEEKEAQRENDRRSSGERRSLSARVSARR